MENNERYHEIYVSFFFVFGIAVKLAYICLILVH